MVQRPDPTPLGTDRRAEPWWAEMAYAEAAKRPATLPFVPPGQVAETAPHDWGVGDCLAAFGAGSLRPSALVAHLLERAAKEDADRAYLWSEPKADCSESDARWAEGRARPLEGVPFAVKSIVDVAEAAVTCGSVTTGDRIAERDALVVARLRAAGAIPIAMAATTEFAAGSPFNPRHGVAPNPWDRDRWTGGSSTGSGGALAARLVPLALGTDTGGSIRVPSAWCGVTGLKPTRGLLPLDGVATLSWTLDHIGPMARSAADLVRPLAVMAGPAAHDHRGQSVDLPLTSPPRAQDYRIGVPSGWFDEMCAGAVLTAWRQALDVLARAGVSLVPFSCATRLGDLESAHLAGWDVLLAELAATQEHHAPMRDAQDKGLQHRIAMGEKVTALAYAKGLSARSVMLDRFVSLMDDLALDVIVTPGLGGEAGHLDSLTVDVDSTSIPFQDIIPRNTMMFDLTGLPALMLPTGLGPNGLPVAMQIVGRPFADGTCLALGMFFQALTRFHLNAPPERRPA